MNPRIKNSLLLFFTGFFLGPLGDYCHVLSQTNGYPSEVFHFYLFGIPFWVPFLFGTGTLAMGCLIPFLDARLGAPLDRVGSQTFNLTVYGLLTFMGLYALSGFLPFKTGGFNDLILAAGAIVVWLCFDRTWQGVLLAIGTAVVGTLVEIGLVKAGAFFYLRRSSNLWGVPSWLPWLYFAASVAVGNLGRFLKQKSKTY